MPNNQLNKLHNLFHAGIYLDHIMFYVEMLKYLELMRLLSLHFKRFLCAKLHYF